MNLRSALRPLAALVPLVGGCAATPDLTYSADADATGGPRDGGAADAATDAAAGHDADAGRDALPNEGGAIGCPSTPPPGAETCCGAVPCLDKSGNGCSCSACANLGCGTGQWCCTDGNQTTSCKPNAASCK